MVDTRGWANMKVIGEGTKVVVIRGGGEGGVHQKKGEDAGHQGRDEYCGPQGRGEDAGHQERGRRWWSGSMERGVGGGFHQGGTKMGVIRGWGKTRP